MIKVDFIEKMGEGNTERAARRNDGTGYTVPFDMTYKEWRTRYVSGEPQLDNDEQICN